MAVSFDFETNTLTRKPYGVAYKAGDLLEPLPPGEYHYVVTDCAYTPQAGITVTIKGFHNMKKAKRKPRRNRSSIIAASAKPTLKQRLEHQHDLYNKLADENNVNWSRRQEAEKKLEAARLTIEALKEELLSKSLRLANLEGVVERVHYEDYERSPVIDVEHAISHDEQGRPLHEPIRVRKPAVKNHLNPGQAVYEQSSQYEIYAGAQTGRIERDARPKSWVNR